MKYRKKPVVIDAYRPYEGEIPAWFDDALHGGTIKECSWGSFDIQTLEGVMHASPGDYIIRGVKGEFYACKPDVFKMTYEPAEQVDESLSDHDILLNVTDIYAFQKHCDVFMEKMVDLIKSIMEVRRLEDDQAQIDTYHWTLVENLASVSVMVDQMAIFIGEEDVKKMRRQELLSLDRLVRVAKMEAKHEK